MLTEEHGYIYAIGYDGEIKVGKTVLNPNKRLTQMQSGNCRLLELIAATYTADYNNIEKTLHTKLKQENKWIRGEWFRLTPEEARALVESVGEDMVKQRKEEQRRKQQTFITMMDRSVGGEV